MPRVPLKIKAATTALITIECQNGIVGAESALPELADAAAPMLATLGMMAQGMRAAGCQVVHLVYVPAFGNRSSNRMTSMMARSLAPMDDWTAVHPATQVVPEIGVDPRDLVVPRHSGMSPTYRTEVFPMLRNAGFDTVVLAGVSLNIAIPLVAAQAVDESFTVIVARDTVAGTPREHGDSMLKYTVGFLATITTADELVAALY
ncbi:MAG: isochorismatase family protein [Pseudonocardiales bacterium]|nr:isochorismatase family protein [Pseudonocardiales bacterium]